MRKVAQRFCRGCPRMSGYRHDERSDMWVCGNCGLPSEMYYLALRAQQPEGVPIRYAKGIDEEPTRAIRGRARAR